MLYITDENPADIFETHGISDFPTRMKNHDVTLLQYFICDCFKVLIHTR